MPNLFADLAFALAMLLLAIAGLYGLLRPRRRWLAWLALPMLCGPPLLIVATTGYRYVAGTARLRWHSNQPRYREFDSLEPNYRAFVEYLPRELWWKYVAGVEQYAFVSLLQAFGPMRGSYLGPYPSREQARTLLLHAESTVTLGDLARPFTLDGRSIAIPPAALARALADAPREAPSTAPALDLALVEQSCLLLGYWAPPRYHAELIDLSGFGWFAHYVFPMEEGPLPPVR